MHDSLQALSLANVFQICTGPPSRGPHSPYHFRGGVRDPCQNFPFPSPVSPLPAQLSAPRSKSQQLEEPLDLCPGASCINSVLRKSWVKFWKTSLFFFPSRRFSSVTQTASCRGEQLFTRLGQNSVFEGQGKICVSAFDYGKTNVIWEMKKKKKKKRKNETKNNGSQSWNSEAGSQLYDFWWPEEECSGRF